MHSTAHASGMAWASFPPQAADAARHKAGRMRLPPAKSEYRIARWIVAGFASAEGKKRSKARLTASVRVARNVCSEKDMRLGCREWQNRVQAEFSTFILLCDLDPLFYPAR